MTREEFESILEEAYNDGYNQAIEDIQEDILDEEAFDLEGEYNYYSETLSEGDKLNVKKLVAGFDSRFKKVPMSDKLKKKMRSNFLRTSVATLASERNNKIANDLRSAAKQRWKDNNDDEYDSSDYKNSYLGKFATGKQRAAARMYASKNKYTNKVSQDADKAIAYSIINKHKKDKPEFGNTNDL